MINGKIPGILGLAMAGEEVGTLFLAAKESFTSRKHWIAYTLRPKGRVIVDEGAPGGAVPAGQKPSSLRHRPGRRGIRPGDCVRVCGEEGTEFARGMVDYSHQEIGKVLGHRSSEIEDVLGYRYGDEIIHRDNLVVL